MDVQIVYITCVMKRHIQMNRTNFLIGPYLPITASSVTIHAQCTVYVPYHEIWDIYLLTIIHSIFFSTSAVSSLTQLITSQSHSNTDSEPHSQASKDQFVTTITLHRKAQTLLHHKLGANSAVSCFLLRAITCSHKHCHLVGTVVKFYTFHYI